MLSSLIKFIIEIFKSVVTSYLKDGVIWLIDKVKNKTVEVEIIPTETQIAPHPIQRELVPVDDSISIKNTEESFTFDVGFFKWFKRKREHIFKRNNK